MFVAANKLTLTSLFCRPSESSGELAERGSVTRSSFATQNAIGSDGGVLKHSEVLRLIEPRSGQTGTPAAGGQMAHDGNHVARRGRLQKFIRNRRTHKFFGELSADVRR